MTTLKELSACLIPAIQVQKSRQVLIHTHNETPSVVAVCVSNEDRSPARITIATQPQLQPALLRFVSDDLPRLHCITCIFITG
jgi:hypothetical protein